MPNILVKELLLFLLNSHMNAISNKRNAVMMYIYTVGKRGVNKSALRQPNMFKYI